MGIPIELLSMGGSAIVGFVFKYMANAQADRMETIRALAGATQEAREYQGGVWVRRFIVFVMMGILAFIVVAPALIEGVSTTYVEEGWFFTHTTEVKGIIYDSTIRSILVSIVGFYFGGAAAARS